MRFYFLDGVRGIAALTVALYHFTQHSNLAVAPLAYFAVDLFFVLSGFVIAFSYEQKILNGLSFSSFMTQRAIRLYPLFLIGLILGTAFLLVECSLGLTTADQGQILLGSAVNLLYVPFLNSNSVTMFGDVVTGAIFPANDPAWSLFFELAVNIAFFFALKIGRWPLYIATAAVFAVFLRLCLLDKGGLGWGADNILYGVPRVLAGFFAGVCVWHFLRSGRLAWSYGWIGRFSLPVALAIIAFFLTVSFWPYDGRRVFTLAVAAAPFLVLAGAKVSLPRLDGFFSWLGALSYPVYCLHFPMMHLTNVVLHQTGSTLAWWHVALGLAATIALSQLALVYWDAPLRTQLRRLLEHFQEKWRHGFPSGNA
ncbi:acyltransferase family protein [Rhizobium paknamense]|uniref:Peptidoglycan/LPS O-acetylase OafA/YrhL n=1 Tax=Rhizobium paknamense TaxID=1206817 RepID=A0ABU0ICJ5_9HYPH|nr:acyltransferase [Rhizobium paknamense]MDQ0455968.1 peptidoglycan/LPS O-acetylase OafA/YrhL [Rhizobium paknamense]